MSNHSGIVHFGCSVALTYYRYKISPICLYFLSTIFQSKVSSHHHYTRSSRSHLLSRDVLVRHWAICKDRVKSGNDIPKLSQKRRGKKRQSCLPCHKLKRACNLKSPCNECAKRNIECIFTPLIREDTLNSNGDPSLQLMVSDVPTDPTLDTEVPLPDFSPLSMNDQPYPSFCMPDPIVNSWDCGHGDNLQLTLNSIPRSLASPSCPIWSQKLAFLAQFTRNTGLAASFDCGDVQLRQQLVLTFASGLSWIDSQPSDLQTTSPQQPLDQLDHQQNFRGDFSQLSEFPTVLEISTSWSKSNSTFSTADSKYSFSSSTDRMGRLWREWSGDPLAIKTHEIVVGIKRAVLNKRRKSCIALTWSVLLEEVCYHFFAPSNLKSFLMAFYSIWEPNWPAFHMATFNVADAPSTLIAGMALIGACLMPDHISQNAAVPWFEAVEEWVFDDDNFCEDPIEHETDDTKIRSRLDAVRAAYCVVLYQTWEGSEESKRRIRRTRYTHLINVSRSVGYSNACHGDLKRYVNEGPTLSNWRRFSLKEETIRTLTYVFLLDCAYGIFNNTAPRMVVHELQMELSSPEHIFQAKTPQSWFERVETWAESDIGRSRILVSDAVKVICDETLSPVTFQMFLQMTLLNFFTLIHGKNLSECFGCSFN